MAKLINILMTISGTDLGPYDVFYLNALGVVIGNGPTNVPKSSFLPPGGYTISVPNDVVKVRLKSKSQLCNDYYVDKTVPVTPGTIPVVTTTTSSGITTTTTIPIIPTTSTSTATPTTSTTTIAPTTAAPTTAAPTTTLAPTTAAPIVCRCYTIANTDPFGFPNRSYTFLNCDGNSETGTIAADSTKEFCAAQGSILGQGFTIVGNVPCFGFCGVTNTTTGSIITTLPPETTTSTARPVTIHNLCYSIQTCDPNNFTSSACNCSGNLISQYYSPCPAPLAVGCILYTNVAMTIPVTGGFYSEGIKCMTVNGSGVITAINGCPAITTTSSTTRSGGFTQTKICCAEVNLPGAPCSLVDAVGSQTCFDLERFPCDQPNLYCSTTTSP
jgi:hypothetical protein